MDPNGLDQAEADHHRQHDRAAIGQEGHGHAHHWRHAHHHRPVDQHIEGEGRGDPCRCQPTEVRVRHRGRVQGREDDGAIQQQHRHAAEKPELLGQGGEDEVRLFLGKEVELALGTQAVALTHEATGAQGNLGLQKMVAGARGVALRVQEGQDPLPLVIVEAEEEEDRCRQGDKSSPREDDPPGQAGQDHHRQAGQGQQNGGPKVRLVGDKQGRGGDQGQRDQEIPGQPRPVRGQAMIEAPKGQDEAQLHDLRRLETAKGPKVQPPLRAHSDVAGHLHHDEQDEAQGVEWIGHRRPDPEVDDGQGHHQGEGHAKADQVVGRPGLPAGTGDGEHHQGAGARDQDQGEGEDAVDVKEFVDQPAALGPGSQSDEGHAGASGTAGPWATVAAGAGGRSIRPRSSGSCSRASRMRSRARGAAAWAPKPPCSTRTATA